MKHDVPQHPSVVVYVNDSACDQSGTQSPGHLCGPLSGPLSVVETDAPTRFDPAKVHREFPERWRAYIHQNYRNLKVIMQTFNVSERTARKWWSGETGANGGHVAVAVNEHPVEAPRMLFAAE